MIAVAFLACASTRSPSSPGAGSETGTGTVDVPTLTTAATRSPLPGPSLRATWLRAWDPAPQSLTATADGELLAVVPVFGTLRLDVGDKDELTLSSTRGTFVVRVDPLTGEARDPATVADGGWVGAAGPAPDGTVVALDHARSLFPGQLDLAVGLDQQGWLRVDRDGAPRWALAIDGSVQAIDATDDGDTVGCGIVDRTPFALGSTALPGAVERGGWAARVAPDGTVRWAVTGSTFCADVDAGHDVAWTQWAASPDARVVDGTTVPPDEDTVILDLATGAVRATAAPGDVGPSFTDGTDDWRLEGGVLSRVDAWGGTTPELAPFGAEPSWADALALRSGTWTVVGSAERLGLGDVPSWPLRSLDLDVYVGQLDPIGHALGLADGGTTTIDAVAGAVIRDDGAVVVAASGEGWIGLDRWGAAPLEHEGAQGWLARWDPVAR